jgi:hypothetical protein
MKAVGVVLLVLGVLWLAVAVSSAPKAPDVPTLVGTFLPGLACLIVGLKLGQTKKPKPGSRANSDDAEPAVSELDPAKRSEQGDNSRSDSFKFSTNLGVGCGIALMLLGSALARATEGQLLAGSLIFFGGWAWAIWGCVNYMRWKGRSGWFGLFGYLLLPGLIILACFPNRRNRILRLHRPEHIAEIEALSDEDRRAGYRFLLTLVPLGLLFIVLGGVLFYSRSSIDSSEWKEVAPSDIGFRALMPGTPRLEQNTQETPAGKVELHKFAVKPTGKKELFMIVSTRFPEAVSRRLGGPEQLLELGRKDLLFASQGELKSERRVVLSGYPGLELEVLPPKGAIIKARIYATKNQIYQVSVGVPKIRLTSRDVQKFFDSFRLSAENGPPQKELGSLAQARSGFKTKLIRRESTGVPVPQPPPDLFQIVRYDSPVGKLAALLSPDPKDGKKYSAIIWITGGDCNTIDEGIWKMLPADFDQTSRAANAFRQAGIVMMFPTLRGGNDNPGFKEGLFGEVDDVLAAANFLSKQPFVDPQRIYLGGLSTGGTLVLLVAASSDRFRAVFSFGPAGVVTDHSPEYLPFATSDPREVELRSPINWLQSIKPTVFVFEGVKGGNVQALLAMKRASTNPRLHFYPVKGAGHVTVLGPVAQIIANKIARDDGPETNITFTEDELNKAFAK